MEMTSLIIVGVVEHIQLGNVTVYGDSNTAGQFMAKNLAPSLEIARNLPIADSLKQIITGKKNHRLMVINFLL